MLTNILRALAIDLSLTWMGGSNGNSANLLPSVSNVKLYRRHLVDRDLSDSREHRKAGTGSLSGANLELRYLSEDGACDTHEL